MSLTQVTAFLIPEEHTPDAYATRARQLGADDVFDTIIVRPDYDTLDARERGSLLESVENSNTLVIASGNTDTIDLAEQSRFVRVDDITSFEQAIRYTVDHRAD